MIYGIIIVCSLFVMEAGINLAEQPDTESLALGIFTLVIGCAMFITAIIGVTRKRETDDE